jgi:Zn-dependent metalloprotease
MRVHRLAAFAVGASICVSLTTTPSGVDRPTLVAVAPASVPELRQWDVTLTRLEREDGLRLRESRQDPFMAGRIHDRFDQYHLGVRVVGGDLVRQSDAGQTISMFGGVYQGITADVTPAFGPDEARMRMARLAGTEIGSGRRPELVLVPNPDGLLILAYALKVFDEEGYFTYYLDARTGSLAMKQNELKSEAAKGIGTGVLGDEKKISVSKSATMYRTSDELRPPAIDTFDLRGNVSKTIAFLNGAVGIGTSDLAADTDNVWSDPASVDAHAYTGFVYDYMFKRFNRRGLDNRDIPIVSIVHPVNRQDIARQHPAVVATFYLNAGYFGDGVMVYGEGLPPTLTDSEGRHWNYTSGALDIVAHELTHGVTDFTSRLIYQGESGALNESFSDILGVGAEFFHQPPGDGPLHADYILGEDVITPGGIRSMSNPSVFGHPDHYSLRYTGPEDNGGVHINCAIPNQAYYLAVEGGTNRTSRLAVSGVGPANRAEMERIFYRAFTELLPSNATFAMARAATLQAARDLSGSGSAAERAIAQAWTAVGVN